MNKLPLLILTLLFFSISQNTSQANESVTLTTPRGDKISVTIHIPAGSNLPALIVAPGQSCNSKGTLFDLLGLRGQIDGVAVFRFEWSYCNSSPQKPEPSPDLKNELEDFETVLNYAKRYDAVDPGNIYLSGKSLGSMVSYRVFRNSPEAKGIILFTPVCSEKLDDQGHSLPVSKPVWNENYPDILAEKRRVFFISGNKDHLCDTQILYDLLSKTSGHASVFVAGGDHGYRVLDSSGKVDQSRTERNLRVIVEAAFNWIGL